MKKTKPLLALLLCLVLVLPSFSACRTLPVARWQAAWLMSSHLKNKYGGSPILEEVHTATLDYPIPVLAGYWAKTTEGYWVALEITGQGYVVKDTRQTEEIHRDLNEYIRQAFPLAEKILLPESYIRKVQYHTEHYEDNPFFDAVLRDAYAPYYRKEEGIEAFLARLSESGNTLGRVFYCRDSQGLAIDDFFEAVDHMRATLPLFLDAALLQPDHFDALEEGLTQNKPEAYGEVYRTFLQQNSYKSFLYAKSWTFYSHLPGEREQALLDATLSTHYIRDNTIQLQEGIWVALVDESLPVLQPDDFTFALIPRAKIIPGDEETGILPLSDGIQLVYNGEMRNGTIYIACTVDIDLFCPDNQGDEIVRAGAAYREENGEWRLYRHTLTESYTLGNLITFVAHQSSMQGDRAFALYADMGHSNLPDVSPV